MLKSSNYFLAIMETTPNAYQIEKQEILLRAYRLLCCFFANQQISEIARPDDPKDPLKKLESRFLYAQVSTLLLEIAILYRALDDQYERAGDSEVRGSYLAKRQLTNANYGIMMFHEDLSLRECCNKIIHADSFEPELQEGLTAHRKDYPAYFGGYDREIAWHHLSGVVQITGTDIKGKEWAHLIQIPVFVEALAFLLSDG